MLLSLDTITIKNQHKRSVTPSFVSSRIDLYNGKKIGKKRALTPELIEQYRNLDKLIKLPFKLETGKNSRFIMNGKTISTPKRGGNHIRYFTTDKHGQLTKVSDRGIIWYLSSLTCQSNKKESFKFGQFGARYNPTIDHSIAQSTLDRWFLKGIIEKDQIQYIGNYLLMRDSKNSSKNNRSEYLRVDRYFTDEEVKQAKTLLDNWFVSTDLKSARIFSINKAGEAVKVKATCFSKLVLWYQVHQLINSDFYAATVGSIDFDRYPFAMVERFHNKEYSRVFYI